MAKKNRELFDRLREAGLRKPVARALSEIRDGAGNKAQRRVRAAVTELRSLADELERRLPGEPAEVVSKAATPTPTPPTPTPPTPTPPTPTPPTPTPPTPTAVRTRRTAGSARTTTAAAPDARPARARAAAPGGAAKPPAARASGTAKARAAATRGKNGAGAAATPSPARRASARRPAPPTPPEAA